jgi:hypothetical protein
VVEAVVLARSHHPLVEEAPQPATLRHTPGKQLYITYITYASFQSATPLPDPPPPGANQYVTSQRLSSKAWPADTESYPQPATLRHSRGFCHNAQLCLPSHPSKVITPPPPHPYWHCTWWPTQPRTARRGSGGGSVRCWRTRRC